MLSLHLKLLSVQTKLIHIPVAESAFAAVAVVAAGMVADQLKFPIPAAFASFDFQEVVDG